MIIIAHDGPRTIAWGGSREGDSAPLPAPDPFAPLFPGEEVVRLDDVEVEVDGVRMTVAVYETRPEQAAAGA